MPEKIVKKCKKLLTFTPHWGIIIKVRQRGKPLKEGSEENGRNDRKSDQQIDRMAESQRIERHGNR
jgi:hypothetical protein